MKNMFALLLVLALLLGLCPMVLAQDYTASAKGFGGNVTVTLTMDGGKITAAAIEGAGETPTIGGAAFPTLIEQLVAAGNAEIDGVAGATVTSDAVKVAAKACIDEANGVVVATEVAYVPGTYTGTAMGMLGPITAEVTVTETEITAAAVTACNDTNMISRGLKTAPVESIPAQVVAHQSLAIDAVSGATVTSNGVLGAITDALSQTGVNLALLQNKAIEKTVQADESFTCDIVVAGAGGAGLSAAIEAASNGANVILVEKTGVLTGESIRCGGLLMAIGTPYAQVDKAEYMDYLVNTIGRGGVNAERVSRYLDSSASLVAYFESIGTKFDYIEKIWDTVVDYPTVFVATADNPNGETEIVPGFHTSSGEYYTEHLYEQAVAAGVKILFHTPMTGISTDESGRVTGITCTRADGSTVSISADATILATGSYGSHEELMSKNTMMLGGYYNCGPTGNVGDGIFLAQELGAKVRLEDRAGNICYNNYLEGNYNQALLVTPEGKRFTREHDYFFSVAHDIGELGFDHAWHIIDASFANPAYEGGHYAAAIGAFESGAGYNMVAADSVADLAAQMGMDAAVLEATLARYNELCAKGVDEDFGKDPAHMKAIAADGSQKLYALKLTPSICGMFGGLYTDIEQRVLNTEDAAIEGLYGAGSCAVADFINYEYPGCGYAFGHAVYSGHTAALTALADLGFENVQSVMVK